MGRWLVVACAVLFLELGAVRAHAQCGGICLYENGSPDLGRASAGAGARAQDAFAPLFGGYFTTELPHGIRFGLASSALYGGAVDYDSDWTGRGYVVDASLLSFLIQPSLAYPVTEWLSLGAGPAILFTTFSQRLKAVNLPGEPTL